MNIDDEKIIETFKQTERDAGGLWNAMPSMTLDKTAIKLGVPRNLVRNVMFDHWAQRGAG